LDSGATRERLEDGTDVAHTVIGRSAHTESSRIPRRHGSPGRPSRGRGLHALHALRDEGLLELRRGRGITVAATPEQGALVEQARELVRFARRNGYQLDELIKVIENVS